MTISVIYEGLDRLLHNEQKRQILAQTYSERDIATLESLLLRDRGEVETLLAEAQRLAGDHRELIIDKLLRIVLRSPEQIGNATPHVVEALSERREDQICLIKSASREDLLELGFSEREITSIPFADKKPEQGA